MAKIEFNDGEMGLLRAFADAGVEHINRDGLGRLEYRLESDGLWHKLPAQLLKSLPKNNVIRIRDYTEQGCPFCEGKGEYMIPEIVKLIPFSREIPGALGRKTNGFHEVHMNFGDRELCGTAVKYCPICGRRLD